MDIKPIVVASFLFSSCVIAIDVIINNNSSVTVAFTFIKIPKQVIIKKIIHIVFFIFAIFFSPVLLYEYFFT